MSSETTTEFGVWTADGQPWVVEYSLAVLDDIRVAVVDGLHRLSRGGIEVGGVLYGEREDGKVRILAQRPIECEYAKGPCFVLSEKDLQGLSERVAPLENLTPVGWYHSHTRTGILLDATDIELFNRFFPLPWQVALVLHPEKFGPVTAGFFLREGRGQLRAAASYREFDVPALSKKRRAAQPEVAAASAPPVSLVPAGLPVRPPRQMAPRVGGEPIEDPRLGEFLKKVRPARARRRKWLLALGACLAAFGVGVGSWSLLFPSGSATLALHAWDEQNQLRIEWDRTSRPVQKADRAVIEIDDGGARTGLPLDREHLQKGSLNYARRSADVAVGMTLYQANAVLLREATRFLGPAPTDQIKAALLEEEREAQRLTAEAERTRVELEHRAERKRQIERQLKTLQKRQAK